MVDSIEWVSLDYDPHSQDNPSEYWKRMSRVIGDTWVKIWYRLDEEANWNQDWVNSTEKPWWNFSDNEFPDNEFALDAEE